MLHNEKIQKTISTFIESQLPQYLELHYKKFSGTNISKMGRFIQLYYEWLEKSYSATIGDLSKTSINSYSDFMISHLRPEGSNIWDALIRLESFRDVDNTRETLLRHIRSEYNPDLPFDIKADRRKLVKLMKDLNRTRGTVPSFKSYFSLVFNKNAKVLMKQDHVFTTNANKWSKKSVIRVLQGGTLSGDDMSEFKGYYMVGRTSGAKAVVAGVTKIDLGSLTYRELQVDKDTQTGTFSAGEVVVGETEGGLPVYKSGTTEQLIATIQNSFQGVTFTDASTGGSGYYLDDVVTLGTVTNAEARIKKLTKGKIEGIQVATGISNNSNINIVNDYLTVYALEGTFVVGKEIIGAESGTTATLRFKDTSGGETKYWIDNVKGKFLTDQVRGGEYSSEEIYYYDAGTTDESIRMRADKINKVCEVTAEAIIDYDNETVIATSITDDQNLVEITDVANYFSQNDILSIGNEFVKIQTISSTNYATIVRGQNGTSGTAHEITVLDTTPSLETTTVTSDYLNKTDTTLKVNSVSGITTNSILRIGSELLTVSNVNSSSKELTIARGHNSTEADHIYTGNVVSLVWQPSQTHNTHSQTSTSGSGSSISVKIITDSLGNPTFELLNDGSGYKHNETVVFEDAGSTSHQVTITIKGPTIKRVSAKIISSGVGYMSFPKLYLTNSSTDSLQPYGTDIGGIEQIEIVRFGLVSDSSSVSFRDTSSGSSGHIRATGTVTYGAEITYGGEDVLFKSNPSQREARVTDADFYTWYSYIVSASEPPETWKEQLKRFSHPAGMKVFADYLIDTTKTATTSTTTLVTQG